MPNWHNIPTQNGYKVPLQWHPPAHKIKAGLLFLPALGTPAQRYSDVAARLSQMGYGVALLEQRGQGKSSLRASRRVNWGYLDFIQEDIPAAIKWMETQIGKAPLILGGHSLGGQIAVAATALIPELIAGLFLVAAPSPYYQTYPANLAWKLRLAHRFLPLITGLLGYFPGNRLGLGDREARTLMADWMQLAIYNRFRIKGPAADLESGIARFTKPVLSVRFDQDMMAPQAAVACMQDKLAQARLTAVTLSESDMGGPANHYGWTKASQALSAVWEDWCASALRISS